MSNTIKAAIITGVATIVAGFIGGMGYGKSSEQKNIQNEIQSVMGNVINVTGNDNQVTINSIKDLVDEYQILQSQNKSLLEQNSKYFSDLTEVNYQVNALQAKTNDIPEISFNNLSLSIDARDIPINKNNSMAIIDGREYISKEMAEKLLNENQSITIKDDTLFIGKVVADRANLVDQYQMSIDWCKIEDSITDSFGNIYANAIHFWHFQSGYVMYNLKEKYSNLKCKISGTFKSPLEGGSIVYVIADDNIVYTSPQINKLTEPFEIDVPINNCSVLKIRVDNNTAIISDAIVYN